MVDLPEYPRRLALTEAPRSGVAPGDIAAPYAMFARAMDNAAEIVKPIAIEEAEARGAEAVTIGPDGTPQITEMNTLGVLGQAYQRGARAHYFAQLQTNSAEKMLELRQQFQNDPKQFDNVAKLYNKELVSRAEPALRPAVSAALDKLRLGHYLDLSERDFAVAQANAKTALETQFNKVADNLVALARKGGVESGEYLAQAENAKVLLGELGKNPRWGYGPAVVEDRLRRLEDRGRAAAVLSSVDTTYDRVGPHEAVRQAETAIFDPGLRMDEAERQGRFNLVKAHIAARKAEATEDIREIRVLAEPTITALRDGVDLEADGDLLRAKMLSLGDTIGAARITYAMEYGRGKRGQFSIPTAEWQRGSLGDVPKVPARATARAGFSQELQDPTVKARLAALTQAEVGGQGPAAQQAFIETIMNRAAARGQTLAQTMTGDYFPAVTHQRTAQFVSDPNIAGRYDGAVSAALAGSNVGKFATGNASGTVRFNGGPGVAAHGGERFGVEGPDQAWAQRMGADVVGSVADRPSSPLPASAQGQQEGIVVGGLPASQIAGLRQWAGTTFDGMMVDAKKSVGKWHIGDEDVAFLSGRIFPFLDEKRKRQAVEFLADAERTGALLDLSPDARQVLRNSLEEAAASGNHAARAALLDEEERFATLQRMEQETPLLRGVRAGWIKPPPPVPWQGADDQVAATMQAHARAAMLVTNQLKRPVSAFEGEDLRTLTGALDMADTSGKVRILGALSTLPPGVREATFGKLHETGQKGAVFAFAGGLAKDAPNVAAGIVRGRDALAAEPRFLPQKESEAQAFTEALDTALPASAFSIGHRSDEREAYATMRAAVRARYADLSAGAGDASGLLKRERLERAVEEVTGGTVRHNGATILAPKRGMDQSAFDNILLGLTDTDLAGARTTSGKPVTAQYLRDSATLESFAPGRYFVRLNRNAESPQYAAGNDGSPFVLRLDDMQPPASRAWGVPPSSSAIPWTQSNFGREPSGWPGGGR